MTPPFVWKDERQYRYSTQYNFGLHAIFCDESGSFTSMCAFNTRSLCCCRTFTVDGASTIGIEKVAERVVVIRSTLLLDDSFRDAAENIVGTTANDDLVLKVTNEIHGLP